MPIFGNPTVPEDKFKSMVKCDWLTCISGLSLAGVGRCFLNGIWWSNNCPTYKDEEEALRGGETWRRKL